MTEVAEFLAIAATYRTRISKDKPAFPEGKRTGRERNSSPSEIMQIISNIASRPGARRHYLDFIMGCESELVVGAGECIVLPTIVQEQDNQEIAQILDLYYRSRREISQDWYNRPDAIANAA